MIKKLIFKDGTNKNLTHFKTQKGITLIALIITIVVLLILAVVAINSIQNYGILEHAQTAAGRYNNAVANEQSMLQEYQNYLKNYIGGTDDGDDTTEECTHDWDDGKITTEPDCETPGEKTLTCKLCPETKTEPIPASGHDWNGTVTKAATCANTGIEILTCTVCSDTETKTIPKLTTHKVDKPISTVKATCTTRGYTTYVCACGAESINSDFTEKLPHDYYYEYENADDYSHLKYAHCNNCTLNEIISESHNFDPNKYKFEQVSCELLKFYALCECGASQHIEEGDWPLEEPVHLDIRFTYECASSTGHNVSAKCASCETKLRVVDYGDNTPAAGTYYAQSGTLYVFPSDVTNPIPIRADHNYDENYKCINCHYSRGGLTNTQHTCTMRSN